MLKVRTILVPIQFHETTLRVIGVADSIARYFHSEVVLLHVITPESYSKHEWKDGRPVASEELISELFSYAETDLHEKLLPALKGLPVKCIVRQGDASSEIVAAAKDEAVDLIVMPTRGRKGWRRPSWRKLLWHSCRIADSRTQLIRLAFDAPFGAYLERCFSQHKTLATDAAFSSTMQTTFVGSIMPASTKSRY